METENRVIAIVMEKIGLKDDKFLLRPIKPIVGTLDNDEDTIITDDKGKYVGAYSSILSGSVVKECYYYDMPLFELVNKYNFGEEKATLESYFAEISSSIHIATCCEDGSLEVADFLLDDLEDLVSDCAMMSQSNGHLSVELTISDIDKILKVNTLEDVKAKLTLYRNYLEAFERSSSKNRNAAIEEIPENRQEHSLVVVQSGDTQKNNYADEIDVGHLYDSVVSSVKAQDDPIEDIVTTIASNYMSRDKRNKSHILITGPTGTGKTEIIECISKYINVPMAKYDMTQVSVTGYVGKSVEDILIRLYMQANQNISVAERGILALDEIDKKASDNNGDVAGRGVLNSLLKLLDGTVYDLELERGSKKIPFDTSNLTVVGLGAFADISKIKGHPMGFNAKINDSKGINMDIDDYVKYGIPEELMGRFTTLVTLNALSIDDLKDILLTSHISPLLIKQEFLRDRGIRLNYTDAYIEAVAKRAVALKTGARSLKTTVEYSLKKAEFQLLRDKIYKEVIIDGPTVSDNRSYVLK